MKRSEQLQPGMRDSGMPKPTGCCSVCGRYRQLTESGLLKIHKPHGVLCDGSMKYPKQAKKPAGAGWAAQRRACLARDKRCQKCRSTDGLEAHHKRERVYGGTDDLDNLITLCSLCHEEWTYAEPPASVMTFEDWLLIPPARLLLVALMHPWPDDVSAFDFKFTLLEAFDKAIEFREATRSKDKG